MSLFKPDSVCTRLRSLLREYHSFSKVMLFGSRARGDCTETSDYDLAVWAEDESQSGAFLAALEELPTLHSFDVVFIRPRHLGTALYDSILGEGVVLMDKFAHKLGNFRQALSRLREGIADAMQTGNLTMRDGAVMEYLCYFINSISLLPYVTGSAQPKMTQAKMNTIPVPVPSFEEQEAITVILEKSLGDLEKSADNAERVLESVGLIKKAILGRAFRGLLGTNDPTEGALS